MSNWADYEADRIVHITHLGRPTPAVADLGRWCAYLGERIEAVEAENIALRRELAATRARTVPTPRKAPVWWIPLAYLGIAWQAGTGTYDYEREGGKR